MRNEYETWLKGNAPTGQGWTGKLLPMAAAVLATVAVGLSVVMMAGLGLPSGELPAEARAPAEAPQSAPAPAGQTVRYAQALPPVTVVSRREPADNAAAPAPAVATVLPARPTSGETATVGVAAAGDNLGQ